MDTCIGAIIWFVCGYGFAFGNIHPQDPNKNEFIG
jgi:ammonia channel protein AmtB